MNSNQDPLWKKKLRRRSSGAVNLQKQIQARFSQNLASMGSRDGVRNQFKSRNLDSAQRSHTASKPKCLKNLANKDHDGHIEGPGHLQKAVSETVENVTMDAEWYTEVFAWGSNHAGQMGLGANQSGISHYGVAQPKAFPFPRFCTFNVAIRSISCGEEHAAFITSAYAIYTMGRNHKGQLGIGDTSISSSPSPILVMKPSKMKKPLHISCGASHTIVCTDDGEAYSWGEGFYGALGIGKLENQYSPQQIQFPQGTGGASVVQISCGTNHSAFIDQIGRLFTCGLGESGQLGHGSTEKFTLPKLVIKIQEKVRMVACGQLHTLALTQSKGQIYAWGSNSFGQLGLGNNRSINAPTLITEIASITMRFIAAGSFSGAISHEKGELYLWGTGTFGEFPIPQRVQTSPQGWANVSLSIGNQFGCAVTRDGLLYSWGLNSHGQLAQGDTEDRGVPEVVHPLKDKHISFLSCGGNFGVALGQTLKNHGEVGGPLPLQTESSLENPRRAYPDNDKDTFNQTFDGRNKFDAYSHLRKSDKKPSAGRAKSAKPRPNSSSRVSLNQIQNKNTPLFRGLQNNYHESSQQHLRGRQSAQISSDIHRGTKPSDDLNFDYTPLRSVSPDKEKGVKSSLDQKRPRSSKIDRLNVYHSESIDLRITKDLSAGNDQHRQQHRLNVVSDADSNIYGGPQQETTRDKQLMIQLEINRQLNTELDAKQNHIASLTSDNKVLTDNLWREQSKVKSVESELHDLRLHLKVLQGENADLKLSLDKEKQANMVAIDRTRLEIERMRDRQDREYKTQEERIVDSLQRECSHYRQLSEDLERQNRVFQTKLVELEAQLDHKRREMLRHEDVIGKYGDSVQELEIQFEVKDQEMQHLRESNQQLQQSLERERIISKDAQTLKLALDEEMQRRKIRDRECEQLRVEFQSLQQLKAQEFEHYKRTIDELRLQAEESLRKTLQKEEDIRNLNKDVMDHRERAGHAQAEVEALKLVVSELEQKNRRLSDRLNEIIFNKASVYKQKTIEQLNRAGGQKQSSPLRFSYNLGEQATQQKEHFHLSLIKDVQYRTQDGGYRPKFGQEMSRFLGNRSPGRERYDDPMTQFNIYRELERFEMSNQKSPSLLMNPNDYSTVIENNQPPVNTNPNHSPLRAKSSSPQKVQHDGPSVCSAQLQEKIKYSCDKLASALGLPASLSSHNLSHQTSFHRPASAHTTNFRDYPQQTTTDPQQTATFSAVSSQRTPPPHMRSEYHKQQQQQMSAPGGGPNPMTSSMIRKSLHDLRSRLDSMKREHSESIER